MRGLVLVGLCGVMLCSGCGLDSGESGGTGGRSGSGGSAAISGTGGTAGTLAGTGGVSGTGGMAGVSPGGTGGGVSGPCVMGRDDTVNGLCPFAAPTDGACAPKGACCFRSSNAVHAREAWDNTGTTTLEFRVNASRTTSQPNSLGNPLIQSSFASTLDQEWAVSLLRIEGLSTAQRGPVTVTFGPGRANCDGSFSFFGEGAAPNTENRTDPSRWQPIVSTGTWDWSARPMLSLDDGPTTGVHWFPVARDHGVFGYEQPQQDPVFDLALNGDSAGAIADEDLNCVGGGLQGPGQWAPSLRQTTFYPVASLRATTINSLALQQNFCSFIALGFMAADDCNSQPQSAWVEQPTGLCDSDGCYVASETDPENTCDGGTKPCCDPTGTDDLLAPCNAFVIHNLTSLAAVEITTEPFDDPMLPFANCNL